MTAKTSSSRRDAQANLPLRISRKLIAAAVQGRWLGLYGEPRVNVLQTNLALDAAFPMAPAGAPESRRP